jgi:hypothetical protein
MVEYQRVALTTTDPGVRRRCLHLPELWTEMVNEAKRRMNASSPHEGKGAVLLQVAATRGKLVEAHRNS